MYIENITYKNNRNFGNYNIFGCTRELDVTFILTEEDETIVNELFNVKKSNKSNLVQLDMSNKFEKAIIMNYIKRKYNINEDIDKIIKDLRPEHFL